MRTLLIVSALLAFTLAPARGQEAPVTPEVVARTFYDAFVRGEVDTLERLYAPDVRFRDELFTFEDRAGTMGMWRQLLAPEREVRATYELLDADDTGATVRWIANYRLPSPRFGRAIRNVITARLTIREGKIVEHTDSFSWAAWSRQAFPFGKLSTWPPFERLLKRIIRGAIAPSPTSTRGLAGEVQESTTR